MLTFHVDSFATYTNDDLVARVSKTLRVDIQRCLQGRTIDEIKSSDADWRRFIQGALYQSLVDGCHARYFTPFFIRPEGANHGEYWLVHLSQRHRAQDVMKQVHWKHHNHFIHYGGAGLDMLAPQTMSFRQEYDGGFRFNEVAESATDTKLVTDLDAHIHERGRPQTVADLYAETCNGSPGTAAMYRKALETLIRDDRIVVFSNEGTKRTKERLIVETDIVEPAKQVRIVF